MRRHRTRNGVALGLLLIGIGVLAFTGWWWPGITVVLGIAIGGGLAFRGRYLAAAVCAVAFFSIPFLVAADIPWPIFGPMVLIGLGVIALTKAFFLREQ